VPGFVPPTPPGSEGNGGGDDERCAAVADGTLVTGSSISQTYRLVIGVVVEATADVETVLGEMQSALQQQVAPNLADCGTYASSTTSSGRRRNLQQDGAVQNVVFGPRSAKDFGTSAVVAVHF
jgi:hypothetical protein